MKPLLRILISSIFLITIIIYFLRKVPSVYMFDINDNATITRYNNSIIIIDNFYKYPELIRNYALNSDYKPHSSLYHTMFYNPNFSLEKNKKFISKLESIEKRMVNRETWDLNVQKESNGFFQYLTEKDRPVIHTDQDLRSVIVYLSKNPKMNSGTSFYLNKALNIRRKPSTINDISSLQKDLINLSAWSVYFKCENVFNRAIIFDGMLYHSSDGGFGNTKENARLYQTFFYNQK